MLKEKIESELKQALRAGNRLKLSVLRMLSSALHNREIEKRTRSGEAKEMVLSEEEVIQVIRSEIKKRSDAVEAYNQAARPAAAERERTEAEILKPFLPPELSDAELAELVSQGVSVLGIASEKEFGKLMGWVMARVNGRASGERVSQMIQRRLDDSSR